MRRFALKALFAALTLNRAEKKHIDRDRMILIFSTWLGWFPGAVVTSNENTIFLQPQMLILPIITLTLIELGYVLRITRSSMVEVMHTNYIRTATLKGSSDSEYSPFGSDQAPRSFFAQNGPPGCTSSTSKPAGDRRYMRIPALRVGMAKSAARRQDHSICHMRL